MLFSSVTSVCTNSDLPPARVMAPAVAAPVSSFRSAITTAAPSSANSSHVARPIPCPPPVTTATLSFSRFIQSPLPVDAIGQRVRSTFFKNRECPRFRDMGQAIENRSPAYRWQPVIHQFQGHVVFRTDRQERLGGLFELRWAELSGLIVAQCQISTAEILRCRDRMLSQGGKDHHLDAKVGPGTRVLPACVNHRRQSRVVAPKGKSGDLDGVRRLQNQERAQRYRPVKTVIHPVLVQAALSNPLFKCVDRVLRQVLERDQLLRGPGASANSPS